MDEVEKQEFLKEFGDKYGYPNSPKTIDQIRPSQFNRLNGLVYLDHAGATLYSELQMEAIFRDLNSTIYGNPHSQSDCSLATSDIVREARQQVLDFCNASPTDYKCIFTSGATAGCKLIGEAFPWSSQSNFMYTMENHNSVLGIREYALAQGASACAVDIEEDANCGSGSQTAFPVKVLQHPIQKRNEVKSQEEGPGGDAFNLFAFPSECNFSGSRYSLELVNFIKSAPESGSFLEGCPLSKGHWMVLIDAAKGCATEPPDLSKYEADFVVLSFYKLFGYPTGCGALLVRTEAAKLLKKKYFSGGTVSASIADIDFVKRREGIEESFEDGTISFLSIAATLHGFKILNSLTMPAILRHTTSLAAYLRNMLLDLRHDNGTRLCTVYGNDKRKVLYDDIGPIISFNLKRPDGSWFGYREVEKLASLSGIQLRTGCFCNPGACAKYLGLSHLDLLSNIEAGHVCWDDQDIVHGKPTGAVRVSFGYMSTFEDVKKFLNFIRRAFVSVPTPTENVCLFEVKGTSLTSEGAKIESARYWLQSITVYPIKSCAGFRVENWPLSRSGLLHDREWLLRSPNGEILTQKKVPDMCFISTYIDLNLGLLHVESPRCKTKLRIELEADSYAGEDEFDVYAQRYQVHGYDTEVAIWFSKAVGRPCVLLRCSQAKNYVCLNNGEREAICRDVGTRLNFVNEAQFLLISEESVSDLNKRLNSTSVQENHHGQIDAMRFRPNLVIAGGTPYAEDKWRCLKIGNKYFMSVGGCNRCQMINLYPQEGTMMKSSEPLATLASYRRVKGKIFFGILLRYDYVNEVKLGAKSWLQIGEEILPETD